MQFSRDNTGALLIRSYSPGELHVAGERYTAAVIITAGAELHDWSPPPVEDLEADDLARALDPQPELVLLGTGTIQRFPPQRLLAEILRRGIGVEVMTTDAACRTFNVLAADDRRVAAALLL